MDARDEVILHPESAWMSYKRKAQRQDYKKCFCLSFTEELKLTGLDADSTPRGWREKKQQKTHYDKRWGEGSCYTSVQFQHSLFSMHVCLTLCAWETSEIREDEEKMLWSKAACKKVFSSMSLVPITLLFRIHVGCPHTFLEALGEKVERVPRCRH